MLLNNEYSFHNASIYQNILTLKIIHKSMIKLTIVNLIDLIYDKLK